MQRALGIRVQKALGSRQVGDDRAALNPDFVEPPTHFSSSSRAMSGGQALGGCVGVESRPHASASIATPPVPGLLDGVA